MWVYLIPPDPWLLAFLMFTICLNPWVSSGLRSWRPKNPTNLHIEMFTKSFSKGDSLSLIFQKYQTYIYMYICIFNLIGQFPACKFRHSDSTRFTHSSRDTSYGRRGSGKIISSHLYQRVPIYPIWRFAKMGITPKSSILNRMFHYKPSVLGSHKNGSPHFSSSAAFFSAQPLTLSRRSQQVIDMDWSAQGWVWVKMTDVNVAQAGNSTNTSMILQGLVNVPFWEYWTSPYSSHYRPYT